MRFKKAIAAVAMAGGILAGGLATAAPASAHACPNAPGGICLYYNSAANNHGASVEVEINDWSYHPYTFACDSLTGNCNGAGQPAYNRAASVKNYSMHTYVVYYNSGWDCSYACQTIARGTFPDLNPTMKNNNASGQWVL
ncbi:hypothetical protein ACFRAR_22535 [Kitasatospora sp. NPDC056651]|uniref:hypothetical protein n=1 Tax=Kitasatospora sp. NPDC056651 TaxID=3345892 RepID=UPI0036C0CAA6